MSDFEIAYLFSETADNMSNLFMNFATLLIAFVVGSFVAAPLLNRLLTTILLGMYSVALILTAFPMIGASRTFVGLAREITARARDGGGEFSWHSIATVPDFIMGGVTPSLVFLSMVSYAASLAFFFECRKRRVVSPRNEDTPGV